MDFKVLHDPTAKQFYIELEDGERAVLDYEREQDKTLNMYHTEVPVRYQGKGIAKYLAKAAFDYAVDNDYKILPTCTYLQKFATNNKLPQYALKIISKR